MKLMSISEVCELTGVTSRSLRHYQTVGLLQPSQVAASGLRYYDQTALLQLQHILVLKQLGLSLNDIAGIVNRGESAITAIDAQLRLVQSETQRLHRMAHALELTKLRLESGEPLMAQESFDGFAVENPYAEEAQQRWPDTYAQSQARIAKLPKEEQKRIFEQHGEIARGLGDLLKSGAAADSVPVQELIDRHYKWICNFWTPDAKSYSALGQMYVDDERFTATYESFAPGLALFIRDAILHHAASNLA